MASCWIVIPFGIIALSGWLMVADEIVWFGGRRPPRPGRTSRRHTHEGSPLRSVAGRELQCHTGVEGRASSVCVRAAGARFGRVARRVVCARRPMHAFLSSTPHAPPRLHHSFLNHPPAHALICHFFPFDAPRSTYACPPPHHVH